VLQLFVSVAQLPLQVIVLSVIVHGFGFFVGGGFDVGGFL